MREFIAKRIWLDEELHPVHAHGLFRREFTFSLKEVDRALLHITADSRYRVYVNGVEAGMGPVRAFPSDWRYDTLDVTLLLREGGNVIAVQVWHYGQSNYQYIEASAGLMATLELYRGDACIEALSTDESWRCLRAVAYDGTAVKRNVNLGWMESFDARQQEEGWELPGFIDASWSAAAVLDDGDGWGGVKPRELPFFEEEMLLPRRIERWAEVTPRVQVLTLSLRESLFPERRDADANIFSAVVAVRVVSPRAMQGVVSFPHSRWNGLQGRIKLGANWLPYDPAVREVPISLQQGEQLMMIELCGIFDDLFVHMELELPEDVAFVPVAARGGVEQESPFTVYGPFQVVTPKADGMHPVYGGVEKLDGLDRTQPDFVAVTACEQVEQLKAFDAWRRPVRPHQVRCNEHIYSLVSRVKVQRELGVRSQDEAALRSQHGCVRIMPPTEGRDVELILDFGTITAGPVTWDLRAPSGTVLDVYGFESMPHGQIEFTEGLNNSIRYVCREGRQAYVSMTRLGFRYLMLTLRELTGPVELYSVKVRQQSFPAPDSGTFRCSDPLLNDVWAISRRTHVLCMEDTFVDCPTYEQTYWTGDAQISALINHHIMGSYELVRRCVSLATHSTGQSRLIPALMPTDWQAAIPFWTFNWMLMARQYAEYARDEEQLRTWYPHLKSTLDTYLTFVDERDLFDISSWNLLDWAPNDISNRGVVTAQQGLLAMTCRWMAEAAGQFDDQPDIQAAVYEDAAARLIASLHSLLWSEEKQAFIDGISRERGESTTCSMQTHVLLLWADVLDEQRREQVAARVLDRPSDWVQIGSPFLSFYLYEVWARLGKHQEILDSIRGEWGMMLRHGSTTCWETFPGFHQNRLTRSYAHGWSAAPAYVFARQLLGIESVGVGFDQVRLLIPETDVDWAEGSIPTVHGRMDVSWERSPERTIFRLTAPESIRIDSSRLPADCELYLQVIDSALHRI